MLMKSRDFLDRWDRVVELLDKRTPALDHETCSQFNAYSNTYERCLKYDPPDLVRAAHWARLAKWYSRHLANISSGCGTCCGCLGEDISNLTD